MSRKKFTDGWEGLFDSAPDSGQGGALLLFELPEPDSSNTRRKAKVHVTETPAKHAGKSFASDLESFLQEAFEESFTEQTQQRTDSEPAPGAKTRRRPARGLDSLIRSTVESDSQDPDMPGPNTRRLVLFLDEEKIAKLKSIAREERKVLRSVVDQIVAEFIAQYEKRR